MALTYRNTLKGHIVSVPEPADIVAAAEAEAERLTRQGTKRARADADLVMDKAHTRAIQQRQTLAKMDESRRWERYTAPPVAPRAVVPEPKPEPVVQPEPEPVAEPVTVTPRTRAKAARAPEPE